MNAKTLIKIEPYATYDMDDASQFLRVDRKTIYDLINKKEIHAKKVGRGYKFLGENLLSFMGSPSIARMKPTK